MPRHIDDIAGSALEESHLFKDAAIFALEQTDRFAEFLTDSISNKLCAMKGSLSLEENASDLSRRIEENNGPDIWNSYEELVRSDVCGDGMPHRLPGIEFEDSIIETERANMMTVVPVTVSIL